MTSPEAPAAPPPEGAPPAARRSRFRGGCWAGWLQLCLIGWLVLGLPLRAQAHPMPESRVWIDARPWGLALTLQIPLNRLEFALGVPLADDPRHVVALHGQRIAAYLLQHVGARSSGVGWQALRPALQVDGDNRAAELQATLELRAPPGADPRRLDLLVDAVSHEVRTHRIQVLLRADWEAGVAAQPPLLLGELGAERKVLPLVLGDAGTGAAVRRLFLDGARHIAEGADHLLFLLMLLIVAPLVPQRGRWGGLRAGHGPLRQTAFIVTAFTVGHSVTLALGSTGLVTVPARWVEAGVAASIVVVAVHALRPLLRQGEVLLALGFGLLHGLAFSASLSGAGLLPWQHALALLSFNLGIEALQLLLLLVTVPLLLALARARPVVYRGLRLASSALAVVVALGWMVERVDSAPDGVQGLRAISSPARFS